MTGWPDHVVVTDAGSQDINGVFAIQEEVFHEGCPVYGNLSGFSLSVCQCPDEFGELHWGWIIGQGGRPAYGSMTQQKDLIPATSWQCFQGAPPAPTLRFLDTLDPQELARAYLQEARLRGSSAEALEAFKAAGALGPWRQRAEVLVEVAKVLHSSERSDEAMKEVMAARDLWPSCPAALLMSATIHSDELRASEARLAVMQCQMAMKNLGGSDQMMKACARILEEIGPDTLLPSSFAHVLELGHEATSHVSDLGQVCEYVASVEVEGCSLLEVNGVYEPSRAVSNKFVVFENCLGFRLSMETMSRKRAGPEKGWVIGKGAVGLFGTTRLADNGLPCGDWSCFAAASTSTPPTATFQLARIEENILQLHRARLGGCDATTAEATALTSLKFLEQSGDLWRAAFVLTELAGVFRQDKLHSKAAERVSKALELCPSYWEAYLEAAQIHIELQQPSKARLALQQLLTARPKDGRAASLLLQLGEGKELESWLRTHSEIPLVVEYLAKTSKTDEKLDFKTDTEQETSATLASNFQLEDQKEEVHAHWTLPSHIRGKDVEVNFKQDWLRVRVQDHLLFEGFLAHRIVPSESSWTFSSPHLTVMLCKCPGPKNSWPRWEVLHQEDSSERLQRLGGLPFEEKAIHWLP